MIIIRNVFHCHPGQAKGLVAKLKASAAAMTGEKVVLNARVMTDVAAPFWTVIFETESESLETWERALAQYGSNPSIQGAMAGYMEHVTGGHREIWKVE